MRLLKNAAKDRIEQAEAEGEEVPEFDMAFSDACGD